MLRNKNVTKSDLLAVKPPTWDKSYCPILNGEVIDRIEEELDKQNLIVKQSSFITDNKLYKVIGNYDIGHTDSEMGLRLVFRNSYDKSMSFGAASGAYVFCCSNGMIGGDSTYKRIHKGDAFVESLDKIKDTISVLSDTFNLLTKDRELFKNRECTPEDIYNLIGKLFYKEEVITTFNLNKIKRELKTPSFSEFKAEMDPNFSMWDLYNANTFSIKETCPRSYIQNHKVLHEVFVEHANNKTKCQILINNINDEIN